METTPLVDDRAKLRRFGQELANRWYEPCLIVLDPPASEINGYQSQTPYVVLTSQASKAERVAAVERIDPTN